MRIKSFVMRLTDEDGQAMILVALAMGIFLLAAIGLAVDGSNLYAQRQMAQAAADAAAQAGIMSIFDGTNGAGTASFVATPGSSFTCGTADPSTPCVYALRNGFGGSAGDTVTVSFPTPPSTAAPGVALSGSAPTNLIKVSVSRSVGTTLMRLLGPTATTVKATAMAAIVDVFAPVPILVTHPSTPPKKNPPLSVQGTPSIIICGGPSRSIQVNSADPNAFQMGGTTATVDLSHAGPLDDGKCNTGTGADFGTWGGPVKDPGITFLPGIGKYIEPASPIKDPLAGVPAPPVPTTAGTQSPKIAAGTGICPSSAGTKGCTILTPGLYATGISLTNTTALMQPGIYYVQTGGFTCGANCNIAMASPAVTDVTTGTGWNGTPAGGGILVYNSGTGQISIGAQGSVNLIGSPASSVYKNILFFEDRSAAANTTPNHNPHSLGGGGALSLQGTIYLTNTLAIMADPAHYQELDLSGNSGNSTLIQGEIIVGVLSLGGGGVIKMNLNPNPSVIVQQVALVN